MEHQKILNLLNEANDSKFLRRKWKIVSNQIQIMGYEMKLSIIQKVKNLIFVIKMMVRF